MQALFILMLIFVVLVAVFALQNAYPVTITFLKWEFEASLAMVILLSVLTGAISLGLFSLLHQAKTKFYTKAGVKKEKPLKDQTESKVQDGIEAIEEENLSDLEISDDRSEQDLQEKLED